MVCGTGLLFALGTTGTCCSSLNDLQKGARNHPILWDGLPYQ